MKINRINGACGLEISVGLNRKLTLWYFPRGMSIPEHKHFGVVVDFLVLLAIDAVFTRREVTKRMTLRSMFSRYTVLPTDNHSVTTFNYPLVLLSFEQWFIEPTSIVKNIQFN